MANINSVVNFFVETARDLDDEMTNLRLNKLLYFAQGWALAITGKPLFNDDFKAWQYGPVVPCIYNQYKDNGNRQINSIQKLNIDDFSEEEYDILLAVQNYYGTFVTSKLVDLTHKKGSPWELAREKSDNEIITKNSIKDYFEKNDKHIIESLNSYMNNVDIIEPERDKNGVITVTAEGNNGWEI